MSVLVDQAGLSTALDQVTQSAIFFKQPEGDIISPDISGYTKPVQLSDRNGDELVPVGTATSTYMTDGISVEEAINNLAPKGVITHTGNAIIQPNTINIWKSPITQGLTITKGQDIDGQLNHYFVRFTVGDGAIISFSGFSKLKWYYFTPPWTSGKTYEVSIIDSLALWAEF